MEKNVRSFVINIVLTINIGIAFFFIGTLISFAIVYLLPGDPVIAYLASIGIYSPTPAQIQQFRHLLGFDLPIFVRYLRYLLDLITGNWGTSVSIAPGTPVIELLHRLPRTIGLMTMSIMIALPLGFLLGRLLAKKRGFWYDRLIQLGSIIGLSIPVFFLGMSFQFTLGFVNPIFPTSYYKTPSYTDPPYLTGFYIFDALFTGQFPKIIDYLYHMFLPVTCLAIVSFSLITLKTRTYLPHKSREKTIFSNMLLTLIIFSFVFMSAILVESNFGLNGFAQLIVEAINLIDYWVISAILITTIIMIVVLIVISNFAFSLYKFLKGREMWEEDI
ncbi:MAG: ABC transporter permease [Promethearchaeota archaeon]